MSSKIVKVSFEIESTMSDEQFQQFLESKLGFSSDPEVTSENPNKGPVFTAWYPDMTVEKCPCCTAESNRPQTWCGCDSGDQHDDRFCSNGPHADGGCGKWQNKLNDDLVALGAADMGPAFDYLRGVYGQHDSLESPVVYDDRDEKLTESDWQIVKQWLANNPHMRLGR